VRYKRFSHRTLTRRFKRCLLNCVEQIYIRYTQTTTSSKITCVEGDTVLPISSPITAIRVVSYRLIVQKSCVLATKKKNVHYSIISQCFSRDRFDAVLSATNSRARLRDLRSLEPRRGKRSRSIRERDERTFCLTCSQTTRTYAGVTWRVLRGRPPRAARPACRARDDRSRRARRLAFCARNNRSVGENRTPRGVGGRTYVRAYTLRPRTSLLHFTCARKEHVPPAHDYLRRDLCKTYGRFVGGVCNLVTLHFLTFFCRGKTNKYVRYARRVW